MAAERCTSALDARPLGEYFERMIEFRERAFRKFVDDRRRQEDKKQPAPYTVDGTAVAAS